MFEGLVKSRLQEFRLSVFVCLIFDFINNPGEEEADEAEEVEAEEDGLAGILWKFCVDEDAEFW